MISIFSLAKNSLAWNFSRDFELGTIGEVATGDSGFAPCSGCSENSLFSGTSHSGSRGAEITFLQGDSGSPGSPHTTGGLFALGNNVGENGELWYRVYIYLENEFDHSCDPVYKFMRFHIDDTTDGYNSILITSNGRFELSYESTGYQDPFQLSGVTAQMPNTGGWHSVEFYLKLHHTPGQAVARAWIDGILVAENLTHANLNTSSGIMDGSALLFTYWNDMNDPRIYPSKTQYAWVDDIVITNESPSNQDANGNYMIGPIDWGGFDTTPPAAPSGLSVN